MQRKCLTGAEGFMLSRQHGHYLQAE